MGKAIEWLSAAILGVMILWILFSWVDVLSHNSPLDGDYHYHPLNIICMAEEAVSKCHDHIGCRTER